MGSRVRSGIAVRIVRGDGIGIVLSKLFKQSPDGVLVVFEYVVFFVWIVVQTLKDENKLPRIHLTVLEKPNAGEWIRQFVILVTREIVEFTARISSKQFPCGSVQFTHNRRVDALKT